MNENKIDYEYFQYKNEKYRIGSQNIVEYKKIENTTIRKPTINYFYQKMINGKYITIKNPSVISQLKMLVFGKKREISKEDKRILGKRNC